MARLLCGLPMIAYISYLSILLLILYSLAPLVIRSRQSFVSLVIGNGILNPHSLVIGSGTLIVFSIFLIEVSLTMSVACLTNVSYNFLMSVSSPDAVTQCLLV
jgi:hypothetical protein